jgi:hypothetical protein
VFYPWATCPVCLYVLILATLVIVKWYLTDLVFICIVVMTNVVACVSLPFVYFLWKRVYSSHLPPFFFCGTGV